MVAAQVIAVGGHAGIVPVPELKGRKRHHHLPRLGACGSHLCIFPSIPITDPIGLGCFFLFSLSL
jgi:hypothetical protein